MVVTIAGVVYAIQPMLIYRHERSGAPAARIGLDAVFTGRGLDTEMRRALAQQLPSVYLNTQLGSAGRAHVLFVGEATPLYYEGNFVYHTTWDRGPLARALDGGETFRDAIEAVRDQGFTHVLVNAAMLDRWNQSGWSARSIEPDRLIPALERNARLVEAWQRGAVRLYELP